MNEIEISNDFTIDDIHKIREYNAKYRSKMTLSERLKDIRKKADSCEEDIQKYKKKEIAI